MSVTIKDVAKAANTSTATVSKVLNGSYSISQETADRVRKVMEELKYHPNQKARNLARLTNKTVVFVAELGKGAAFSNPHMFEMISGIESYLSEKGYLLQIRSISKNEVADFTKECFEIKAADGFIFHASVLTDELEQIVYENEIPHLVIGMPSGNTRFCWIDTDNKYAGVTATKYLLECGYRSVAFIGGTEDDKISQHRLEGVLSVLSEHEVLVPRAYIQQGASAVDSGYQMTKEILKGKNRPGAIICANNYLAYGCVKALNDSKIKIPDEIGVITFDDFPFSQIVKPALTVVNIDVYDIGHEAGRLIIRKIRKPEFHIQSYITYPTIIPRDSLKSR